MDRVCMRADPLERVPLGIEVHRRLTVPDEVWMVPEEFLKDRFEEVGLEWME